MKIPVKCCLPGKFIRDSAPRVLTGDGSPRQPLIGTYQFFQLPIRKAALQNKPYCSHKQFRKTEPFLQVRAVGNLQEFKFPEASGGLTSEAGLSTTAVRPA